MKRELLQAVRVTDTVWWVGAVDWNIRDFHGYLTHRGTSYNAYLILADKITLVDTVKAPFKNELLSRISSLINPEDISYIISNHSEMDHSGCLPDIIETVKPEKVFASVMGLKTLSGHFHDVSAITAVKDGDSLSLGNMDVSFIETRMLHWPDSMFSYIPAEKLLFSSDAFGMHLASRLLYSDKVDESVLKHECEKYFANILLPYAKLVTKLLEKVTKSGLEIAMILPDHGPIWRTKDGVEKVLNLYRSWAEQKHSQKAVIIYDTMWNSTEKMARMITEGIACKGVEVKLMSLRSFHRSDVASELLDCGALVVGSPTLNNTIFPTVADVMTYLRGLKPVNLIGAVFGSYGWSGEAVKQLETMLTDMKIELVGESISTRYVPDDDVLEQCFKLGNNIAEKLQEVS